MAHFARASGDSPGARCFGCSRCLRGGAKAHHDQLRPAEVRGPRPPRAAVVFVLSWRTLEAGFRYDIVQIRPSPRLWYRLYLYVWLCGLKNRNGRGDNAESIALYGSEPCEEARLQAKFAWIERVPGTKLRRCVRSEDGMQFARSKVVDDDVLHEAPGFLRVGHSTFSLLMCLSNNC